MINIGIILGILFIHWFADFVMQTDEDAIGKSSSNLCLTSHVVMYTFIWLAFIIIYVDCTHNRGMFFFIPITFICHWITDYFTSRFNKSLVPKEKTGSWHNFFVSVGFDQYLHYLQLFLTYYLLS